MQKYSVVRKLQVTTILAYLTGIVIGFYVPESLAYTLLEAVKELAGKTFRENPWEFALEIFIHNMEAVIITVLLSPLVLIPMLAVFVNGVILGVAINYLLESRSWLFVFLALAPHGVLEIPTVLCVYTLSIGFGADLWRSLLGKDREAWKKSGIKLVKGLIASVALLALSAFIEAFITPALITMCKC